MGAWVHFLGYANHRTLVPKHFLKSFSSRFNRGSVFFLSPSGSRPSTPKSDSELVSKSTDRATQKNNLEMLWLWGELPQAAKVSLSPAWILPRPEDSFEKRELGAVFAFRAFDFIIQCSYKNLDLYCYISSCFCFFNYCQVPERCLLYPQ